MSSYIDGFVLPLRKDQIDAYRRIAHTAGGIWREHGALSYRECIAEDLSAEGMLPFPALLQLSPEETVVFAWIEFTSRAERDRINALVMKDPRIACEPENMPFDTMRMFWGGFNGLVEMGWGGAPK